ncbi:MAG: hypothetical protein IT383_10600 [Deltaproteobacteria bacterium]|nr:hypothetical protein [Deltaproteobacteria bacterium]
MIALMLMLAIAGAATEDGRIAGRWKDSERDTVSELTKAADGSFTGVIVTSPRKEEVGKKSFDTLRWDGASKRFVGKLIKPDDGEVVGPPSRQHERCS